MSGRHQVAGGVRILLLYFGIMLIGVIGSLVSLIVTVVGFFMKPIRKPFQKKTFVGGLITFLLLAGMFGFGVYNTFFNLQNLPTGDLLQTSNSPTGAYTVRTYVSNGGATVDDAVRGEVQDNTRPGKPKKTIYWNYHESTAKVVWIDPQTVVINGHTLNVLHDTYDFRRK